MSDNNKKKTTTRKKPARKPAAPKDAKAPPEAPSSSGGPKHERGRVKAAINGMADGDRASLRTALSMSFTKAITRTKATALLTEAVMKKGCPPDHPLAAKLAQAPKRRTGGKGGGKRNGGPSIRGMFRELAARANGVTVLELRTAAEKAGLDLGKTSVGKSDGTLLAHVKSPAERMGWKFTEKGGRWHGVAPK